MIIGEKIKQKRKELGWSQRELSDRMGYSNHSTIARIEAGKVDIPQSRIVQFAEVLGTSVKYLMDWEEVQKNNDVMADIIVRMRTDDEFFSLIEKLHEMDADKLQLLHAFLK